MKKINWAFWRRQNFNSENQENFYKTLELIVKGPSSPLGNYIHKRFKDNKRLVSNIVVWPKIDKELTINELKSELMHDKHLKLFLIVEKGNFIYHPQIRNTKKFPIAQYQGERLAIANRQNVIFEVDNSFLNDRYLSLLFKSEFIESKLFFLAGAGLQGGISWEEFGSLPIKVPSLDLQAKFIDLYELLEKSINIKKKINETLENIMFSKFERIQDSYFELGKKRKLRELFYIVCGYLCPEESNSQNQIIEISLLDRNKLIEQDRKFISNISKSLCPSNEKNYKLPVVSKNSIIIVKLLLMNQNSLAQRIISNVSILKEETHLNHELCGLYPIKEIRLYYGYFLVKSNINALSQKANITRTRYCLNKVVIENFELSVIDKEKIYQFNEFCKPLFELQNCNEEIIKELKSLQKYSIEYIASSS